jgi:predicted transcriptional regulator|tara:strand:+ start:436 stop:771 length:336 start_codon:yes stop_codon:yes gene_type:complete
MTIDREKFFVNIGHWMKLTRNHFNPKHTQSKIGSELNVTFQQVQKYEKAINEISLWNFIKLCDFLKEDINNVVNACKVDGYFNVKSTRVPMCKDEEYRNAGITEDQGQPKK